MDLIIPPKLRAGDTIRIVAPSRSLNIVSTPVRANADRQLKQLSLNVTLGRHSDEVDASGSSSAAARLEDLHDALRDPSVSAILTAIGGYNTNQLLDEFDYGLCRRNPKIICGFSDITALQNAILARSGVVTYSGPHYSTFGMLKGLEYTVEYFRRALFSGAAFEVCPASDWSDDPWFEDQEKRKFVPNEGYWVIQAGSARGPAIGGNLCAFTLLKGTPYMPGLEGALLFLECTGGTNLQEFDRDLQSILQLPVIGGVRGLVLGRFQLESRITREDLLAVIRGKRVFNGIPVIANCDFGHTTPHITFPVGGIISLKAEPGGAVLRIESH